MKKHSFSEKLTNFLNGRGFYIALVLCVAAIGVSGWYLWRGFTIANQLAAETNGTQTVTLEPEDAQEASGQNQPADTDPADTAPAQEEEAPATDATDSASDSQAEEPADEALAPAEEETTETLEPVTDQPAEPAAEAMAEESDWVWPLEGAVVAAFSSDTLTYNSALGDWRTHSGVDLSAELGQEVVAARAGTVTAIQEDHLLGKTVTVDCGDGLTTTYGNLADPVSVSAGDTVAAGDLIGTVGETAAGEANDAAWLHFSVEEDGVAVDPMQYLE